MRDPQYRRQFKQWFFGSFGVWPSTVPLLSLRHSVRSQCLGGTGYAQVCQKKKLMSPVDTFGEEA
jgi:hypothetical protein